MRIALFVLTLLLPFMAHAQGVAVPAADGGNKSWKPPVGSVEWREMQKQREQEKAMKEAMDKAKDTYGEKPVFEGYTPVEIPGSADVPKGADYLQLSPVKKKEEKKETPATPPEGAEPGTTESPAAQ